MSTATAGAGAVSGHVNSVDRARADIYASVAHAISFPDEDWFDLVRSGAWSREFGGLTAELPFRLTLSQSGSRVPSDYDAFQSEYIRLFEIGGRNGSPCPLHSGQYSRDRLQTLEDLLRFYTFFGVRAKTGCMPDHAAVEFEFMSHLAQQSARAVPDSPDANSLRLAQRDFLTRRLSWWPELAQRVRGQKPQTFYRNLVTITEKFLGLDLQYLSL
jgi:DMSO reductase family type II enzyme chaperone